MYHQIIGAGMRMEHGLTSYDFSDFITHHQPTADSDLGNGGNGVI